MRGNHIVYSRKLFSIHYEVLSIKWLTIVLKLIFFMNKKMKTQVGEESSW